MDESQLSLFYGLSFLCVALAFAFAAYLYLWVKKQKTENAKIQEVSLLIKQGANTFMRRDYLVLAQSLSGGDFNNVTMVFCYAI